MFRNFDADQERVKNLDYILKAVGEAQGDWQAAARLVAREAPWLTRKDAVGGADSSDLRGDLPHLAGGIFMQSLAGGPAAFDKMTPSMIPAEFNVRTFVADGLLMAQVVGEGVGISVRKFSITNDILLPVKVAAIAVATLESMASFQGASAMRLALTNGVARATDLEVFSSLSADGDLTQAATSDPVNDIKTLLSAVNITGFEKLFFITSAPVANILATWVSAPGGLPVFGGMTAQGGELYGVETLVTPGVAVDSLILLDASSVVYAKTDLELRTSVQGTLEMTDSPTMDSTIPTGAATISLFQIDLIALLGIRSFGIKLTRTSGVGVLTTIAWTQEVG